MRQISFPYLLGRATVVAQFSPLIGIEADILYSQYTFKTGNDSGWMFVIWNALSFPVYARFSHDFGVIHAYALAGLDKNYIFGDVSKNINDAAIFTVDAESNFDTMFVWRIGTGAGITLPIGPGSLDIGLRYRTDFNDNFGF